MHHHISILSLVLIYFTTCTSTASIIENSISRIDSSEELISSIASNCFERETMVCLKENVLTYLDTILGMSVEGSRSFSSENIDEVIFNRVAKVLKNNEFTIELPEAIITYRSDKGFDFKMSTEEGRGHLLKKKLLFPVLLLLKLKMKALMPIFVALIGLKAMKALILSKIAITLVLGFLIAQLVKKAGMKMPMSMNPMQMMQPPVPEYGAPIPTTSSPSATYEASNGWEATNYNSRVWEPSISSQNLAYSSYYNPSNTANLNSNSYTGTGSSYSSYSSPSSATAPTSSSLTTSSTSTQTSSAKTAHAY